MEREQLEQLISLKINTEYALLSSEKLERILEILKEPEEAKEACPNCGYTKLAYFSSLRVKQCTSCWHKIAWELKEKQLPLVQHQR
jgi:ribosomal protein L37AE/L43A